MRFLLSTNSRSGGFFWVWSWMRWPANNNIGDSHVSRSWDIAEILIYAFCMVFHVRWIFLTTSLRIPPEYATRVGFGDEWWEIHLAWKTIQNAFSRILCTLRHFNQAKYTVQSCRSWKPCEMDLSHNCSLHGGMSEVCEKGCSQCASHTYLGSFRAFTNFRVFCSKFQI